MLRRHTLLLCAAAALAPGPKAAAGPAIELNAPALAQQELAQGQTGETVQEKLIAFVMIDYLGHGRANHESSALIYADRVQYFERGEISRDAVIADQQAYNRRWPVRSYEYVEDTLRIEPGPNDTFDVSFRYFFEVSNGKRTKRGEGFSELGVAVVDGRFVILREGGDVEKRM